MDADRSNIGLLHRGALKQALCARGLALSSRSAPVNHVSQQSIALLVLLFEQTLPEVCASQTLYHRQLQLALANSDEDPEGLIDYRSVAPHLSKLLLKSQASCLCLSQTCWHLSPTARYQCIKIQHWSPYKCNVISSCSISSGSCQHKLEGVPNGILHHAVVY